MPDVLGRVSRGIFPAPRRMRRSIDPSLEAICMKAMALDPRDRHATALDLANELETWLADVRYRAEQEVAVSQVKASARAVVPRARSRVLRPGDAHRRECSGWPVLSKTRRRVLLIWSVSFAQA